MVEWINWLHTEGDEPLYEVIYKNIAHDIRTGVIKEGERLPSKRKLSEGLSVSHSTVETAYGLLMAEGYIKAIPRVGYVAEELTMMTKKEEAKQVSAKETAAPPKSFLSFSTHSVDTSGFPYSSFAKIYREVIYQNPDLLNLGDPKGDLFFRQALSTMLSEERGVRVTADRIIVGAGVEMLLGLLFDLLQEENVIAMEDPGYPTVYSAAKSHHKRVEPVSVDAHGIRVDELEKTKARLVFVTPSHEYPMGVTMSAGRRSKLLSWAEKTQGWIIEDDYDSVFRYATRPIPSLQGMLEETRVIYLGTFSRSIAPSIRCAYMVLPRKLMDRYDRLPKKRAQTVSRFEQETLALFLNRGLFERHLRRMTHVYKARSEALKTLLKSIPDSKITGDEAGLHFLLHLPKVDEKRLLYTARKEGLELTSVRQYCHGTPVEETILVLGFAGLNDTDMQKAVGILKRCNRRAYRREKA